MRKLFLNIFYSAFLLGITASSQAALLQYDIDAQYTCNLGNCDVSTIGSLSFDDSLLLPKPWDTNIIGDVIPGSSLTSFDLFGLTLNDFSELLLIVSYISDWPDPEVTPGLHITFQGTASIGTLGLTEYEEYYFQSLSYDHLRDMGTIAYTQCTSSGVCPPVTGTGVYSVTPATIPIPSAIWLFGSGLLGLLGVARRKKIA
jgi:hypothetical protein